jgi:hypothetical protein
MPSHGSELVDFKVLYDQQVDCVEIHYAEWAHLQLTKMVDVFRYDHLRLAPQHLIKGTDFILKCIWTIINHKGTVDGYRISDEFFKATGQRLSDFFEFTRDDILTFLRGRRNMF